MSMFRSAWALAALMWLPLSGARAVDCLSTTVVDWTLPDGPVGPEWSATTMGIRMVASELTTDYPFAIRVWRRPCGQGNLDAQVVLTFDHQTGSPNIGSFSIRQGGTTFSAGQFFFTSNKPSIISTQTIALTGTFGLSGDISGILHSLSYPYAQVFDPKQAFQLVQDPMTFGPSGNVVIDVPAYDPAAYTEVGQPYVIGPSTTGTWWNANQSGHGLLIEAFDGGFLSVVWFVFNDDRTQAWVGGAARYSGNTVTIDAYKAVGAQAPPLFKPGDVQRVFWGKFRLTFSDCNNGTFEYQKVGQSIWNMIPIRRTIKSAGSACPAP
jgi:hypothetical protein